MSAARRRLALATPLALLLLAAAIGARAAPDVPRLLPDLAWQTPSFAHPLGYGEAGLDLFPTVAQGTLRGLALAIVVACIGVVVGVPLGAAAAFARGRFETIVVRTCDLVQAFPTFFLAMAVLAAVPVPGRVPLAFVFSVTAWAPFARLAVVETRILRGAGFVEAAVALGARPGAVLVRHLLPQLLPTAAVQLGASAAAVLVSEAALAFLGLGPADGVSLGAVLDQGVAAMLRAPHVLTAGALAVWAASLSLLLAGRAASDA